MKLAYIVLAHRYPEHLLRLVHRLDSPDCTFVVHIDRRSGPTHDRVRELVGDLPNLELLAERRACRWGRFSIVEATMDCLRHLRASGRAYDYAVLVSGQDYPLRPRAEIEAFFAEHRGQEFIESFPMASDDSRFSDLGVPYAPLYRVEAWHFFLRSRFHWHFPRPRRRLPHGLVSYGGSQWWALTRECADHVVDYVDTHPKVARYFRRTFIPDESFFQTIVSNSPHAADVVGRDHRFVDWANPNPTAPRVLVPEDFDRLRESDALFGRKFDPERSAALLERIDAEVLDHHDHC